MADNDLTNEQRLEQELAQLRAENTRLQSESVERQQAEARERAIAQVRSAGALTAEEQKAVEHARLIDPKLVAVFEAGRAADQRRAEALLKGSPPASSGQGSHSGGFDAEVTRILGRDGWRDTIATKEYGDWYRSQPAHIQAMGRTEDPVLAGEVLKQFYARGDRGDGTMDDPRLQGARSAPGDGPSVTMTRMVADGTATKSEVDDYMHGWNEAGKEFEDNYTKLRPGRSLERIEQMRERVAAGR